jgi:hypothetical protein
MEAANVTTEVGLELGWSHNKLGKTQTVIIMMETSVLSIDETDDVQSTPVELYNVASQSMKQVQI